MPYIVLEGPINRTGYGNHFVRMAHAIINHPNSQELGIDYKVIIVPIGMIDTFVFDTPTERSILRFVVDKVPILSNDDIWIRFWHEHDQVFNHPGSYFKISFPVFELDRISSASAALLNKADMVFVPTDPAVEVLTRSGVNRPIGVFPELVTAVQIKDILDFGHNNHDISISHIGKFEKRKGCYELIKFLSMDSPFNITLNAYWHNPFIPKSMIFDALISYGFTESASGYWVNPKNRNSIHLYLGQQENKTALYTSMIECSDYIIFPSFAEGFNIPLAEVLAALKPFFKTRVIYSDIPGHSWVRKYVPPTDQVISIKPDFKEPAIDGVFFKDPSFSWDFVSAQSIFNIINDNVTNVPFTRVVGTKPLLSPDAYHISDFLKQIHERRIKRSTA